MQCGRDIPRQKSDFMLFDRDATLQFRDERRRGRQFDLRLLVGGFGGQSPLEAEPGLMHPSLRVSSVWRTMDSSLSRAISS